MKNTTVFLAGFLLFINSIMAQELTQTIRGKIIDEDTHYPLPGASVILLEGDKSKGTSTNTDGTFQLNNVPVGRQDLQISFVGYETKTLNNLIVKSGKELVLNIKLKESVKEIEEVVVKANRKDRPRNEMAKVSARSFTIEETEKYAGSWGDPSRMAQNFAGVISAGDQRNDIIIRGNPPIGLLWRLEGVNIPNPNHFGALGATGGPVSILNNNVLANSDFFTGAFPAEYGNALSGVFDLQMRNGNNKTREYTGQIGFNGFELGIEGPFTENSNSSYLANYRYSTLDVFDKLGIDLQVGAVPEYQDITYKFHFPTKKGSFSIWGIGGLSHIVLGEDRDSTASSFSAPRGFETTNGSDMGVTAINYTHFFNKNTRWKNSISLSGHRVTTTIDSVYENRENELYYHENNSQWQIGWYSKFVKKLNTKNRVDAGFSIENYSINYIDSVHHSWTNTEVQDTGFIKQLDVQKNNLPLLQIYTQWQHRFSNELTLYTGLNFQYFGFNKSKRIEPRTSIEWKFKKNNRISLGYGSHSQLPPMFLYFVETPVAKHNYIQTNRDLGFSKSSQLVLSYDHSFNPNLRLKTETYYQFHHDIPVEEPESYFSLANYGASFHQRRVDSLVNKGKSRNYGIELTLEKFFNKNYYFLLTASLFESKYKPTKGGYRNTAFNGNYVVNLLGGYEMPLGNQNTLSINLRVVSAGGKRFTPIDLEASRREDYTIYKEELAYQRQLPDYFRMDGRVSLKINNKNTTQEWAIDITNLTDQGNVFSRNYDIQSEKITTEYQQRFFPVMTYRINF